TFSHNGGKSVWARIPTVRPEEFRMKQNSTPQLATRGIHAVKRLLGVPFRKGINYDPHNRIIREQLAEEMFVRRNHEQPLGTVGRSQLLLNLIEESFPTAALTTAYFENLSLLLQSRRPLDCPGIVVLGFGSGRSGSTSL